MNLDDHYGCKLSREGFKKMIMSELRDFSRRKLFQAIKWNQDADSLDRLMVFKIILTEIDGMCFPSKEDSNTGPGKLLDLKAKVGLR